MALTTDARTDVAAALTAAGITAHATVPATVVPPCVIVAPDDPYIELDRLGPTLQYLARFRLGVLAKALDNHAGLATVEQLIDDTIRALPDGVHVDRVGQPTLDDLGAQGGIYAAEITITAHLEE